MKKTLILVDKLLDKHKILADVIKKEGSGTVASVGKMSDIAFYISDNPTDISIGGKSLKHFDLVFFRRVGGENIHLVGSIIVYLDKLGIEFIDRGLRTTAVRGDKLTSLMRLALAGVPVIPTIYGSTSKIKFTYPLIAKEIHEHHLKGVYSIKNEKELETFRKVKGGKRKRFIFQPFLDLASEYRLLVLGGKVKVVHTKVQRDYTKVKVDYLDQNAQEVYMDQKDIPLKIKNIAIKAAKVLGLEIAGVDICVEKRTGKEYVLEVNRGPAFNYDEKISPEVSEVSKYIVSRLKGRV